MSTLQASTAVDMQRINDDVIAQFRSNAGCVVDGMFKDAPILLLSTTGPRHPDWYHNVVANPMVTIEVGPEHFNARASVAEGAEQDRLFEAQAQLMPQFREYQRMTDRRIPVVVLERVE